MVNNVEKTPAVEKREGKKDLIYNFLMCSVRIFGRFFLAL